MGTFYWRDHLVIDADVIVGGNTVEFAIAAVELLYVIAYTRSDHIVHVDDDSQKVRFISRLTRCNRLLSSRNNNETVRLYSSYVDVIESNAELALSRKKKNLFCIIKKKKNRIFSPLVS